LYSLSSIQPIHGAELFNLSRQVTHNIAYYLPRNTNLEEVGALIEAQPSHPNAMGGEATATEGLAKPNVMPDVPVPPSETLPAESIDADADIPEYVEVEEEWMGSKLKALTCYFGGLADGQGHLY
jgi:trimethylguanosine synthase